MESTTQKQMTLENAVGWCEILSDNLLDADYRVYTDTNAHLKIEALRRMIERNAELEAALSKAEEARELLGAAIGPVL